MIVRWIDFFCPIPTVNWHTVYIIFNVSICFIVGWMHVVHHTNNWRLDVSHSVQEFSTIFEYWYFIFWSWLGLFSLLNHAVENPSHRSDGVNLEISSKMRYEICTIISLWHLKDDVSGSQYMISLRSQSLIRTWGLISSMQHGNISPRWSVLFQTCLIWSSARLSVQIAAQPPYVL